MRFVTPFRHLLIALLVVSFTQTVWAEKRERRIPLMGCRGHYTASGSARYVEIRGERQTNGEELIIEIKHVPLRPGTTLVVYIDEQSVGTIKLNAKQEGSLKLTSSFGKYVPTIDAGSNVSVKTMDGREVMW